MSIAAHSTLTPSVGAAASAGKLDGNRHAKAAEIVARNCIHAGVVHSGQSKRCKLKDIPLRTPIQVKIGGDVRESPVLLDLVLEGKKGRYTCTPVHAPGCARGHARRPPCLLVYCTVSGTLHRVWYIARVGVYPPRFVSLPHLSRSLPAPPQCPLSRDGALLTFYADATRAQYLLGVNPSRGPCVGPVGTVAFLIRRLADARIQHPEAAIPALKEGMLILTVRYCARARVQHAYEYC